MIRHSVKGSEGLRKAQDLYAQQCTYIQCLGESYNARQICICMPRLRYAIRALRIPLHSNYISGSIALKRF